MATPEESLSAQKSMAMGDSYEKATQCERLRDNTEQEIPAAELECVVQRESPPVKSWSRRRRSSARNPIFPRRGSSALDKMRAAARAANQENYDGSTPARNDVVSLTEEEKENICKQRDFEEFLQRASKIVEKAIGISDLPGLVDIDPFIDYATEERVGKSVGGAGESVPLRSTDRVFARFGEEGRLGEITDNPVVCIWSVAMQKRPEFVLRSHTAVVTAMSDKFNPTIYLGGSASGCVLIWDTRAKSEPHHSVLLRDSDQRGYSISAVAFSATDANLITLGTHDGHIVRVRLDSTTGNSNPWQTTRASLLAHEGMITALDPHPLRDIRAMQKPTVRRGLDDLLASGSVDWTAKLWNMAGMEENTKAASRDRTSGAADLSSILGITEAPPATASATVDTFKDTVTDVRWHPHHPAVLAVSTVDAIHICNLNSNIESPIHSIRTPGSAPQRLAWSADGRLLLAGDAEGRVTLYEADRTVYQPRSEEWTRFEGRLWAEEETTADEI
ncbi:Cytoplasmic dynein 1 intermediate chain, putative [Perkinsus marinus ATCC 50983]|uniref:Cytoplasmic dynein 1 intermediate chain, putative n=1 Tax=Perkinsus marinus (strain ATCC 50983 / TXsc) TaxID=423536 RepID=C5LH51_PERM5|nr:Cytoplasmic dynein 1 intermediate chain, putative [Perkinsus marinus ATCC 50983]EER03860.1 Cytoplasmic dynein 1 intermediate chain, putative [Perkinsus marinus ATCC 50983]|eukprot:XP_002772044.1 Cytoplasmic dynein 1 intermediate chain, putative [Perkinsus marinus ATCC 50983]